MSEPRPELKPVDVDGRPLCLAGSVLWLVALAVLGLGFHHTLAAHDALWWLWACPAGVALGGYGYWSETRRLRRQRRASAQE